MNINMHDSTDRSDSTIEIAWIVIESYDERIRGRKRTCDICKLPSGVRDLFSS
jgi:hypothetical protein